MNAAMCYVRRAVEHTLPCGYRHLDLAAVHSSGKTGDKRAKTEDDIISCAGLHCVIAAVRTPVLRTRTSGEHGAGSCHMCRYWSALIQSCRSMKLAVSLGRPHAGDRVSGSVLRSGQRDMRHACHAPSAAEDVRHQRMYDSCLVACVSIASCRPYGRIQDGTRSGARIAGCGHAQHP